MTVFYESNTGWIRLLQRSEQNAAGGGGGGSPSTKAQLSFIPATKWALDLRTCPTGVMSQVLKMKDLPFRAKVRLKVKLKHTSC